jgi:hypothetical protein
VHFVEMQMRFVQLFIFCEGSRLYVIAFLDNWRLDTGNIIYKTGEHKMQ